MKYINRHIASKLNQLASQYPVVTITGPRQSGKTTLAKQIFSGKKYYNLEDPVVRKFVQEDPRGFFNSISADGAIIDEIQRVPELTSYIQPIVDMNNVKGQFILTGSHQFELIEGISQSLAGRTGLLKLLPLSLIELQKDCDLESTYYYLYNGFYPRIYQDNLNPTDYYGMYLETYIERDLRNAINISNLGVFERFIRLLAGRSGSILNSSSLSNDTGVSVTTIRHWISVLEASYIIFLLQPFYNNISKRLIKNPKIYFYDVGLATFLNGIENQSQLVNHPLTGSLFENMIVTELLKARFNEGRRSNLTFYRDSTGNEVDVTAEEADCIKAYEIKLSQTPNADFIKGINSFKKAYNEKNVIGSVIYGGSEFLKLKDITFNSWKNISDFVSHSL
jgi:predicted AAA+ superfamily ATPase